MFRKGMWVAVSAAGIISLACPASAGDLMQWTPRTPAGGGNPGYLGSYLSQAAAVEYGPPGVVGRDIGGRNVQEVLLKNHTYSSTRVLYLKADGSIDRIDETTNEQETEQTQGGLIYHTP